MGVIPFRKPDGNDHRKEESKEKKTSLLNQVRQQRESIESMFKGSLNQYEGQRRQMLRDKVLQIQTYLDAHKSTMSDILVTRWLNKYYSRLSAVELETEILEAIRLDWEAHPEVFQALLDAYNVCTKK